MEKPGVESWMVGFNEMEGIHLFRPYDTRDMMQGIYHIATELGNICGRGDVKSLKAEINNLLTINKAPVNRPLFWHMYRVANLCICQLCMASKNRRD
jgi:hypothetical protein